MKKLAVVLALLPILVSVVAWLILASPMLAPQREKLVQERLSQALNRPVRVEGDVRVALGRSIRVAVTDLRLPNSASEGTVATLDQLEFELLLTELPRRLVLSNDFKGRGLDASLITSADGTRNWGKALPRNALTDDATNATADTLDDDTVGSDAEGALSPRRIGIDLQDASLTIANEANGFVFDVRLDTFSYAGATDDVTAELEGSGFINGQALSIESDFDDNTLFSTSVTIGETTFALDGHQTDLADEGATRITLRSEIADVGDLLSALGLRQNIAGRGSLTSDIVLDGSQIGIQRFDAAIQTPADFQYAASGSIENLLKFDGIDVDLSIRLHPESSPPPRAASLREIKLTRVDMTLRGSNEDLVLDSLLLSTNAFDQGFGRLGQAAFRRFHRTADGKLEIRDIELRAGHRNAPYLTARGRVGDVLRLQDVSFAGDINVPAIQILSFLSAGRAGQFGAIKGDFVLEGDGKLLQLKRFNVAAVDTDIWSFETEATLNDVGTLDGLTLSASSRIDTPDRFLAALSATPAAAKPLSLDFAFKGSATDYSSQTDMVSGETRVYADLDVEIDDIGLVVSGTLQSDLMALADVGAAMNFMRSVSDSVRQAEDSRAVQPLVLQDERIPQPLVLEDAREVQPLVLKKGDAAEASREFLNADVLLSAADVDLGIEIKRILGVTGLSRVNSDLTLEGGKLTVAPINISYGGATFATRATIDTLDAPQVLSVSGSIGGWDLEDIVRQLGADVGASGTLSGRFAVSGRYQSVETFLRTMAGTVEVGMRQGRIDTSLIELAGLGVLPWLFSREMLEGSTRLVCMKVPMRINRGGRITTNGAVVETPHVQLVARGTVDVFGDRISLRAEPRPVGRPLARSAVPFEVTGALSKPQVRTQLSGARARRADGARTMPVQRAPCTPDIYQLQ